jgi:hypothetical protein
MELSQRKPVAKTVSPLLFKADLKSTCPSQSDVVGMYDPETQQWTIRMGETYTYSQTTNYSSTGENNKDDKSSA